jgi:hypothetical protein
LTPWRPSSPTGRSPNAALRRLCAILPKTLCLASRCATVVDIRRSFLSKFIDATPHNGRHHPNASSRRSPVDRTSLGLASRRIPQRYRPALRPREPRSAAAYAPFSSEPCKLLKAFALEASELVQRLGKNRTSEDICVGVGSRNLTVRKTRGGPAAQRFQFPSVANRAGGRSVPRSGRLRGCRQITAGRVQNTGCTCALWCWALLVWGGPARVHAAAR